NLRGVYYGPFPSSRTIRKVLKYLRRIFPYCQQKSLGLRPCFYSHIDLCSPCPSLIEKTDLPQKLVLRRKYVYQLTCIKRIFEGKLTFVQKSLEKQMNLFADSQQYEQAALIRNRLNTLRSLSRETHTAEYLADPQFYFKQQTEVLENLRDLLKPYIPELDYPSRVECFDISNFQSSHAVGSQTVAIDGLLEKSAYRRYLVKLNQLPNDTACLREVLTRRLSHTEWDFPQLMVIDGGKPQVSVVTKVLNDMNLAFPVIGLAKRKEEIVVPVGSQFKLIQLPKSSSVLKFLQSLRDEAHRFAVTYHRKRRNMLH
ncbi:MAG: UvrB/UvrC motif-containing protein, partial [Patescibacteria group bacterium]